MASPQRRVIRFHVHPREIPFWLLLLAATWVYLLCGCAATPRPVPCESMSQRLLQHRDFATCMTGPWSAVWVRNIGWSAKHERECRFGSLVLPDACMGFDADHDGDVDLRDFREVQNGRAIYHD